MNPLERFRRFVAPSRVGRSVLLVATVGVAPVLVALAACGGEGEDTSRTITPAEDAAARPDAPPSDPSCSVVRMGGRDFIAHAWDEAGTEAGVSDERMGIGLTRHAIYASRLYSKRDPSPHIPSVYARSDIHAFDRGACRREALGTVYGSAVSLRASLEGIFWWDAAGPVSLHFGVSRPVTLLDADDAGAPPLGAANTACLGAPFHRHSAGSLRFAANGADAVGTDSVGFFAEQDGAGATIAFRSSAPFARCYVDEDQAFYAQRDTSSVDENAVSIGVYSFQTKTQTPLATGVRLRALLLTAGEFLAADMKGENVLVYNRDGTLRRAIRVDMAEPLALSRGFVYGIRGSSLMRVHIAGDAAETVAELPEPPTRMVADEDGLVLKLRGRILEMRHAD